MHTNLEQSRKLAKILPIESADMYWWYNGQKYYAETKEHNDFQKSDIPCWSLTSLLNYLREIDFFPEIEADEYSVKMTVSYYNKEEAKVLVPVHSITVEKESFVDACYEMIVKLNESN